MTDGLSWAPQRAVFIRRTLWIAGGTFLALLVIGAALSVAMGWPYLWIVPTALLLSLGFVFDDAVRWRAGKFDRWEISEGHLRHEGQDGVATIPLEEITRVRAGIGNRVVVHLRSGQRVVLRYLPYPTHAALQIDAARPR